MEELIMSFKFPTPEWIEAYEKTINSSQAYKEAGAKWTAGVVSLICHAKPEIGIPEDVGIWLDLEKGVCREAKFVPAEEARTAPFCISGDYDRWKQVIKKELDPIKGMMQGKLKLKGSLPTIVRYVKASKELVNCAGLVPTIFPDEQG